MRFITPTIGTIITKKRFLLLPKRIKKEIRWLEIASWEEKYVSKLPGTWGAKGFWEGTRWLN